MKDYFWWIVKFVCICLIITVAIVACCYHPELRYEIWTSAVAAIVLAIISGLDEFADSDDRSRL